MRKYRGVKVWTIIWELLRKKAIESNIPIHGHFELTPCCNLNCKMCYVHKEIPEKDIIRFGDWKTIIDGAIANGMIFASLTGGECLTHPDFKEIYLYLQSKGIMINVLTNAVILDRYIDFFVENPPRIIQISIYGNNEEEYMNVTGRKVWEKVNGNVLNAIEKGLSIAISVTPSEYMNNPKGIVEKYQSLNIPGNIAEALLPPRPDKSEKMNYNRRINTSYSNLANKKTELIGITCSAGKSDFTINWKGQMMMCVSIYEVFGVPLHEGFISAWKKTNEAACNYLMPIECESCDLHKDCLACPAARGSQDNPGHCNIEVCVHTALQFK